MGHRKTMASCECHNQRVTGGHDPVLLCPWFFIAPGNELHGVLIDGGFMGRGGFTAM
jgi:hypothetical protein